MIYRGRLHPQHPRDVPLPVSNYLGVVGDVLRDLDEQHRR